MKKIDDCMDRINEVITDPDFIFSQYKTTKIYAKSYDGYALEVTTHQDSSLPEDEKFEGVIRVTPFHSEIHVYQARQSNRLLFEKNPKELFDE